MVTEAESNIISTIVCSTYDKYKYKKVSVAILFLYYYLLLSIWEKGETYERKNQYLNGVPQQNKCAPNVTTYQIVYEYHKADC